MANFQRTDNSPASTAPRQKPIVLARLPRIGAATAPAATAKTNTAPAAPTPPPAPAPAPEHLPRLELRGELEERIKLHIAEPVEEPTKPSSVYFADHEHELAQETFVPDKQPPRPQHRVAAPAPSRSKSRRPRTASEKLYELHTQISPYAGLIVALALIASAGLLYWLSVGPAQLPDPHFDSFGTSSQHEGFGVSAQQLPENYVPQFTAELPKASTAQPADDQWKEISLPELTPASKQPEQLPPFEENDLQPQAGTKSSNSPYPKSLASEPLDFAKVKGNPPAQSPLDGPRALPEVATRPQESTTR